MPSISSLFEIGKRALFTYKMALNVVGHNIANVDTPGYTRQQPLMEGLTTPQGEFNEMGSGVRISEVRRVYDKFIELQINRETETLSKWAATKDVLEQIELIFNESIGQGLNYTLNEFWAAWQDLSNKPEGMAERNNLRFKTEALVDVFNRAYNDLNRIRQFSDESIYGAIAEINSIAARIANLNGNIVTAEAGGQNANDLRDQRDRLLTQMAGMVEMTYFEDDKGSLAIYLAGGRPLVEMNSANELHAVKDPSTGELQVQWWGPGGEKVDITDKISEGILGGRILARDVIVPEYLSSLDSLAATLVLEVNKLHSAGVGLIPFTSLTGDSKVSDINAELASSGSELSFYSEIVDGDFEVWIYDNSGALVNSQLITVNSTTTLQDLQASLNAVSGISSTINSDNQLEINAQAGWSFHVSNDTSGALMALGINTFFDGSNSSNIGLSENITSNLNRIAVAKVADGSDIPAGNNLNSLSMAYLQDTPVMVNDTLSLNGYYQTLVASIGIDVSGAKDNYEHQEAVVNQLRNRREAVSGVSLDEELVNLMEYSMAYNAAARLIATARDTLDILLQM